MEVSDGKEDVGTSKSERSSPSLLVVEVAETNAERKASDRKYMFENNMGLHGLPQLHQTTKQEMTIP